ncbi:AzlD domain-containing protein [Massilia glaciei]|uniref:AzlD domain-containing protein n=1 Tax=Massilia glaciei TaxID=1524097 RepID=A0A2U2I510_9BURK|nr:AzlD domain-containing protein [Massilia glaciei]PWF54739.1 AzlD domain-containing protein [Massilia glaciei]
MSEIEIWVTIGVLALATACARCAFWLLGHHVTIPKRVQEMLRYAPGCALAAIIAPDVLLSPAGALALEAGNLKLMAAAGATLFFVWRRNMLQTIVFGMLLFTALRLGLA